MAKPFLKPAPVPASPAAPEEFLEAELDSVMTHTDLANAKMLLALAQTLQALGNDTRHESRIRDVMDIVLETLENIERVGESEDEGEDDA